MYLPSLDYICILVAKFSSFFSVPPPHELLQVFMVPPYELSAASRMSRVVRKESQIIGQITVWSPAGTLPAVHIDVLIMRMCCISSDFGCLSEVSRHRVCKDSKLR